MTDLRFRVLIRPLLRLAFLVGSVVGFHSGHSGPPAREQMQIASEIAARGRTADSRCRNIRSVVAEEILDAVPMAALVTDHKSRVLSMNRAAGLLLECHDHLLVADGVLTCNDPAEAEELARTIAELKCCLMVLHDAGGVELLRICPLPSGRGVLIAVPVTCDGEGLEHSLRLAFGFTPREACFARELWSGRSLAEAARAMAIAPSTARTHLKRLLSKTNTRRQTQLVRCLTAVAMLTGAPPAPTDDMHGYPSFRGRRQGGGSVS